MVLGYNAYNLAIMPDNGLITLDPVVKPTPDQLVGGSNPTRTPQTALSHAPSIHIRTGCLV